MRSDALACEDAVFICACSEIGYVGSAWNSWATEWASRVAETFPHRRYIVTRLALWGGRSHLEEPNVQIWLPKPAFNGELHS